MYTRQNESLIHNILLQLLGQYRDKVDYETLIESSDIEGEIQSL